jgi:predicted porin
MSTLKKYAWEFALGLGFVICLLLAHGTARAADFGGSCCADLEERIAELEATTVRKGNRKVRLEIGGQVNKALYYYDADAFGLGSDTRIIENGNEETRLRFEGVAQLRPGWFAGFVVELGQGQTGLEANFNLGGADIDVGTDNAVYTRQSYAYVTAEGFGTVSVGLQSMATDDLSQQSVANTTAFAKRLTAQPIGGISLSFLGVDVASIPLEPFNGRKANSVKYATPTFGGFAVTAAWASDDDAWDVALTYAGEFAGFKVVGAAGYYDDKQNDIVEALDSIVPLDVSSTTITVNGGIRHIDTGLFVQGTWARLDVDNLIETDAYHVQAGIERKWLDIGATTIFGEYAEWSDIDFSFYGVGVNQNVADAVDLYALARRHEIGGGDVDTFLTGVRVKF